MIVPEGAATLAALRHLVEDGRWTEMSELSYSTLVQA